MELSTIISILRRRAAFVLIALLTGPNILLIMGLLNKSTAAGTTLLISRPANDLADPDRYLASQIGVLGSDELAKLIVTKVPGSTASQIRSSLTIVQRPRTDMVDITVKGTSGAASVQVAKALITSFTEIRDQLLAADIASEAASIESRIAQVVDDLDTLSGVPADDTTSSAAVRRSILLKEFDALIARKTEVQYSVSSRQGPVQVLDAPHTMTIGGRPSMTSLAAAAVGGGLVGVFLILGIAALGRPRVLSRSQAEEILGMPALTEIRHARQLGDRPFLPAGTPGTPFERDFAQACSMIIGRMRSERFTVLVTSTEERAGTSTVARAMAASFEGTNASVLLIDANLENPTTTALLGAAGLPGLGRVLMATGKGVEFKFVREVQGRKILFLPADAESAPTGAISYEATGRLVDGARSLADIVVIDGGTVTSPTSVALAGHVDLVVLVVPVPTQVAERLRNVVTSPQFEHRSIVPIVNRP